MAETEKNDGEGGCWKYGDTASVYSASLEAFTVEDQADKDDIYVHKYSKLNEALRGGSAKSGTFVF